MKVFAGRKTRKLTNQFHNFPSGVLGAKPLWPVKLFFKARRAGIFLVEKLKTVKAP